MSFRILLAILAALTLSACSGAGKLDEIPPALGDFRLGHAIGITDKIQYGPSSRQLPPETIKAAVEKAVRERLDPPRYDGDGLYHLGIFVGGMILAQPGIPVIYAPKSVLLVDVTVIDNTTGQKLTEKPERLTVFEGIENSAPLIGSGYVRGAEEQLANLSVSLAKAIEHFLSEHPDWFTPKPGQERTAYEPQMANGA